MDARPDGDLQAPPPWEIAAPARQTVPLVFASPHSGSDYPPEFIHASRLDPLSLRRSEDSYVDEIFGSAPELGAPLIRALFPRAYIDPNREPFELDPTMFADGLPSYANTGSPRVAAGFGTIARAVTGGAEIYRGKLRFAEALRRIDSFYRPYHAALKALIEDTRARFGGYLLIDCHSMPSVGGAAARDAGARGADFVLGDCHGAACAAAVIDTTEKVLTSLGYAVARNTPYAGGFTIRHYGRPAEGAHAMQIEINRVLYMDEETMERDPYLPRLADHMSALAAALAAVGEAVFANP